MEKELKNQVADFAETLTFNEQLLAIAQLIAESAQFAKSDGAEGAAILLKSALKLVDDATTLYFIDTAE